MQFLDKYNYPVVRIKNRPILNLFRLVLHTRKIKRGRWVEAVSPVDFNCQQSPVSN